MASDEPTAHVVLYQPEIPPNTGNVMRLAANTGALLHLIEPLGFELEAKDLRVADVTTGGDEEAAGVVFDRDVKGHGWGDSRGGRLIPRR